MSSVVSDEQQRQQLQQVCVCNTKKMDHLERVRRVCAFLTICAGLYAMGGMVVASAAHTSAAHDRAEKHTIIAVAVLSWTGIMGLCAFSQKRNLRWHNRHIQSYLKYWAHLSEREKKTLYQDYVRQ